MFLEFTSLVCNLNKTKDTLVPKRERTLLSNTFIQPTNCSANDTLWLYVYDYDYDYELCLWLLTLNYITFVTLFVWS